MARKLAIQLFWMLRKGWDYEQVRKFGPHAGQPALASPSEVVRTSMLNGFGFSRSRASA
jgi:hypothetical protein